MYLEMCGGEIGGGLFEPAVIDDYDIIVANPPYVRTQILGAEQARVLAVQFGLTGRVDLYYAFLLAMAKVLKPQGAAGIIVSNRFMTTKAGGGVRRAIRERFNLHHVWDLGDTKLFDAAVLPAVLLAEGVNGKKRREAGFTSIYETRDDATRLAASVFDALDDEGVVEVTDGRRFRVKTGTLDCTGGVEGIWRIASHETDAWLTTVAAHTWRTFGEIGKIRVGVKTCADSVFIRQDWHLLSAGEPPELLRQLTTHHVARRFKADVNGRQKQILYPHESHDGVRYAVDLAKFPRSAFYLERYRDVLSNRKYVTEAGRQWFEIWVPQQPDAWDKPKLVFRDISEVPCFWIDLGNTVVNGDCYWMICDHDDEEDLLWLAAAVGNSSFTEILYDHRFNNKLYAGRRRFMAQYVEKFPVPNPNTETGSKIIAKAKAIYKSLDRTETKQMEKDLDRLVWDAFGLAIEEIPR